VGVGAALYHLPYRRARSIRHKDAIMHGMQGGSEATKSSKVVGGKEGRKQAGKQPKGSSSKAGAAGSADADTYALYHDFT
jgi:hypothetical protein